MTENAPSGDSQTPRDARARAKADKAYKKASRPWYKKKRFILALIVVIIIIIAVSTSGGDENDAGTSESTTTSSGDETSPTEEGKPAQQDAEAAFPGAEESDVVGQAGDKLKLGEITVSSTALTTGKNADIAGPTLCTTVSLKNGSDETIDFNPYDWKMQEPGGTIMDPGIMGSDDTLPGGQIAPGGTTSGDVCFDSKGSESGTYVAFYEPIFSFFSDRGAWINER